MRVLKQIATVAMLAMALMAPSGAFAQNDRIADGRFTDVAATGAVFWGPSPPLYPYYHYGYYGVPVWGPHQFWGPVEYGCYRRSVWTGRHWRYVRVCD